MDAIGWVAAFASLSIWFTARSRRVSVSHLLTISLLYEVFVCFVIAFSSLWEFYSRTGFVPRITWVVGVIILFPLIVPAPPKQILLAALASALTPALALWLLETLGEARSRGDYAGVVANPLLAAGFAFLGARVVYGLGREVATVRELGSYRLEEKLGQGGMGEVWRARHRMLARPAAIKMVRPASATAEARGVSKEAHKRFEREAQTIAGLRSPHTVTLFDFGVSSDGVFYYVMELLEGLDTDALVRRFGPQPAERVVHVLRQTCHSLSEAESRGLVHRDIKPANIFLCRYGEDFDFVKVLDFGLVKGLGKEVDSAPDLTRENAVHGTPAYMAPEQALGRANIDTRADIYALGCVAYWLLTGQTVFTEDSVVGHLLAHAHKTPETPSKRVEKPIPPELERIVMQCLEKEPARRPPTIRNLSNRLSEIDTLAWTNEVAREWWNIHAPSAVQTVKSPTALPPTADLDPRGADN
jgi:serine/threonine-protein kinase